MTTITGEQLAEAMRKAGMEVQYFPWAPKPGQERTPHTSGSTDMNKIAEAVNALLAMPAASTEADQFYRDVAMNTRHKDGDIEFDDNAKVSHSDDDGAYVQAWVWIPGYEEGEDDPSETVDSEGGHHD